MEFQNQIRENSEDLQKYLLDLESWEREMKKKEEEMKLIQTTPEEEIPPVRNLLYRSKRKNRHKKQKEKVSINKTTISGSDYQAWEMFDAEAELKKIDEEKQSSASENSETEDEYYIQKKKQLAILHKDKGNEFFKNGKYDSAIDSYTVGIQMDPENPLLPANRAMALLKKGLFQAAENDCTLCLEIDPTYVKAYLRRGTARKNLNKISAAKEDFSKALKLEPENKQAQLELKKMSEESKEDIKNIPRSGVKVQELSPAVLESKAVTLSEEYVQTKKTTDTSNVENSCIFPDSSPIPVIEQPPPELNLGSGFRINIMEEDEKKFVQRVENCLNVPLNVPESSEISQFSENQINRNFEPNLPTVPNNSFQFLADWNDIACYPTLRYKYLKQFPPEQLPVIFKCYIEPQIFPAVIETLSTSFLENGDDVFDYMMHLAGVGRFSTMVMFLSGKGKKDLNRLLDSIKTSTRPESEISELLQKYRT